jgi:hypothetical protein
MKQRVKQNVETACSLRARGRTLQEIGAYLGCTRERARQLLNYAKSLNPDMHQASMEALAAVKAPALEPPKIKFFRRTAYAWLFDCGYIFCTICKFVKGKDDFGSAVASGKCKTHICRACGAARQNERYHTNELHRFKVKKWNKENKDRVKLYAKRYQEKNKELTSV